jgi:Uncharacterized proteins, LmbE homologs
MKTLYRYVRILVIRFFAYLFAKKGMDRFNSILILAPHPDDEVFGCAGLIHRAIKQKKEVNTIILTGGENAYNQTLIDKEELKNQRRKLTQSAAQTMGLPIENIFFLSWVDGQIDVNTSNVSELSEIVSRIAPDAIFAPHPFEGWQDHIAASKLADEIINSHNSSYTIRGYKYCVWLWHSMPYNKLFLLDWKHSFLLHLNKLEHQRKLKAIRNYTEPLTPFGKPYSGDLPALFIKANQWNKELYFESNVSFLAK